MEHGLLDSPVGRIHVTVDGAALTELHVGCEHEVAGAPVDPAGVVSALTAWFAGDLGALDAIGVRPAGTSFQQDVWAALRRIPAGTTVSYGELAAAVGRPRAVRAVGQANGRNPVPIVVPCHRVIAAGGGLAGFAYGLGMKRWLLEHERAHR